MYRNPAELVSYDRNARTHSSDQVRQIRDLIDAYGPTNPILIDAMGGIIAGHGRRDACLLEPPLTEFPCIVLAGLSDEQKRLLIVADNKISLNAGWNEELLREELLSLKGAGADLKLMGFTAHELKKVFADPVELSGASGLDAGLQYQVIVTCSSEQDQGALLDRLKEEGRECRPLTL